MLRVAKLVIKMIYKVMMEALALIGLGFWPTAKVELM